MINLNSYTECLFCPNQIDGVCLAGVLLKASLLTIEKKQYDTTGVAKLVDILPNVPDNCHNSHLLE